MLLSNYEKEIVLLLFKDFTKQYNARIISKQLLMTPRGALKALKNLEKKEFVAGKIFGKAIHYKINFNSITKKNIELLLFEEAEINYKMWVEEFKDFIESEILILFGSASRDDKKHNDIDLIFLVKKKNYNSLMKKIENKNDLLPKKIHPVIQTIKDIKNNLIKKNPVLLDAIRSGAVLKGQKELIGVIESVTSTQPYKMVH